MSQEGGLWEEGRYEAQGSHFAEVQCGASWWAWWGCGKMAERRGLGLWFWSSRGLPPGTSPNGSPPWTPGCHSVSEHRPLTCEEDACSAICSPSPGDGVLPHSTGKKTKGSAEAH